MCLAKDARIYDLIIELYEATNDLIVLRCEPDYDIWLLAEVTRPEPGSKAKHRVTYRVTDRHKEYGRDESFSFWTDAHNFYQEVVGAGSWSEYDKEVKRIAVLKEHGYCPRHGTIRSIKYDVEVGHFDGTTFVFGKGFEGNDNLIAAIEKFRKI